jgi:hypothetical protein
MKSKGNNNKPVLKVVTTKTLQPPKRYHSADMYIKAKISSNCNHVTYISLILEIYFSNMSLQSNESQASPQHLHVKTLLIAF